MTDRQRFKILIKMLDLKEEYDNNPQMWGVDWRKRIIKALRNDVCEQGRAKLEQLEKILEMTEMVQMMEDERRRETRI